ncbi:MAG: family metalloprotease [Mucilaginibacter sp.]|nr:family metalloprotease [Mucilaginibacter sp.]
METILYNISQVIGVAIIHSLWQGLLVYLGLRLIVLFFPNLSSRAKHNVAVTALIWVTVWFVCTLSNEINTHTWININARDHGILPTVFSLPLHIAHNASYSARYNYTIEWLLPYITIVYIIGLIFNTGQLVWARKKINHIRQTMSIDVQLQLKVDQFVAMLNITDKVWFGLSKLVDAPCMMGYFKPVILLPFTLSSYLSAEEIEIIILHELAHIKRNDYLINLAQQAMSVLLFFNPFAQLINHIINQERENSCDDIVIEATQKPLVYAHALLKLEQTRRQEWQLALAATGKKYHLLNRIERIMKTKKPIGNVRHILLALALLTGSITGLAWLNPTIANGKISFNKIKPAIISDLFADTVKKKTVKSHKLAATKKTIKAKHSKGYYDGDGFNDPELERLSQEVSKHGEAIGKYYESAEFKKMAQDMALKGQAMGKFYNKPELKELERKQAELGAEFGKKWGNNEELEKLSGHMGELGSQVGAYYSTPEFRKLNEQLEDKYGIPHDRHNDSEYRNDENYKKYQAELQQYIPAEVKEQTEELKKLGEQMRNHYGSPEFREKQKEMRLMGDSMRKAFNNPAMKEQQAEMRKLGEQMRAMQNNPQIKREKELMRQAEAKMRAYMRSPEFKKRMQEMKKNVMNFDFNYDFKNDFEKPERPDAPERPEAPEKPETPDTTGNN